MARRRSSSRAKHLGQPLARTRLAILRAAEHLRSRLAAREQLTPEERRAFRALAGQAKRAFPRLRAAQQLTDLPSGSVPPSIVIEQVTPLTAALNWRRLAPKQLAIQHAAERLRRRLERRSRLTRTEYCAFGALVGQAKRAFQEIGAIQQLPEVVHGAVLLRLFFVAQELDLLIEALIRRRWDLPTLADLPPDDPRHQEFQRRQHFFDRFHPAATRREIQREWNHIAKDLGLQAPCVPRGSRAVNPAFATPEGIPVEHIRQWTIRQFLRTKQRLRTEEPVTWEVMRGDGHRSLERHPLPPPERRRGGRRKTFSDDELLAALSREPIPTQPELASSFGVTVRGIGKRISKLRPRR